MKKPYKKEETKTVKRKEHDLAKKDRKAGAKETIKRRSLFETRKQISELRDETLAKKYLDNKKKVKK